jgi:glycosyltransferase involved in cell wall biosynthesis
MSNLFHKFPERRNIKKKSNPELVIYPILLLMFVSSLALLALDASKSIFVFILLIITYGLLALKNRKSRRPWFGLLYKTIHALSMCLETLRRKIFHRTKDKVMSYPLNDSRYSSELKKALARSEFELHEFYQLTGSETVNTFLLPLTPLIMRVQGYRILHINWLFQFKLHWQVSRRWKYIMRGWFMLWISITKIFGIRIIWTVHDPLPHEQIFDNDFAASVMLMNNCTALIALNEHSLQQLRIKHNSTKSILIPEGPLFMPTTTIQMENKNLLHVAPTKRLIVLAGYLQPYKGVTALLEGATFLPSSLAIRIAGRADEQYQKDLESILIKLKSQNIDIDITFGHLTDDEYGGYLNSADFICIPFIEINNSGSINSALCSGVPVIIPSIPSLNWVPGGARIDISCDSDGHFDFKQLFQSLERISVSEYDSMKKSALLWASTVTWADVARQHIDLYQGITGNHN